MDHKQSPFAKRREAMGFSQEALAERLNIDVRTVRRWDAGDFVKGPQAWIRPKLARCLQVSLEQLDELLSAGASEQARVVEGELVSPEVTAVPPGAVIFPVLVDGKPVLLPVDPSAIARDGFPGLATLSREDAMSPLSRRSLLRFSVLASALPALDAEAHQHVAAAMEDARRYLDTDLVQRLKAQLASCKSSDGGSDATKTPPLPIVLGILGAIEEAAREVRPRVRHQLLSLGAECGEFAGWLYRDAGDLTRALYWHDRAIEWAQVVGDIALQGYVLLKKAQLAYDERNPHRMLDLSQAVRGGAWNLPLRVQAEAAQQEARAEAMLGVSLGAVERKLGEARQLLGASRVDECTLGAHYNDTLLTMQTAVCYTEAGKPRHGVELYGQSLTENSFSPRDYGFFLSWMAGSLALAGEPDEAAKTGLESAKRANNASSQRTHRELERVVKVLAPWQNRPAVKELQAVV
ncbi:helix-turn-helix transcriptional regulator [Lentzea sp. NBRC 102530]|uniref:helix-turn-helix domain-containing protein n=1 Tax=Lentzea sp. NBRC 102530 TaxID=3032201 RepID=UPI0024A5D031|nr:helix-turn-helix transcriptional regulator [Lentzea sp. NBRC 102530]GLY53588.1 transcriptional regulator [Lentzea sp. NBRC 102530]